MSLESPDDDVRQSNDETGFCVTSEILIYGYD